MPAQVLIILNEREQIKLRAAETLFKKLSELNISTLRAEIELNLAAKIIAFKPDIVVIDYILGDIGTGVDLLIQVKEALPTEQCPSFIFLSDERGIRVVSSAMKLGARDYIDIESPSSITETIAKITTLLHLNEQTKESRTVSRVAKSSSGTRQFTTQHALQFTSPAILEIYALLRGIIGALSPGLVVSGASGTGKRGAIQEILRESHPDHHYSTINLHSSTLIEALSLVSQLRSGICTVVLSPENYALKEIFALTQAIRARFGARFPCYFISEDEAFAAALAHTLEAPHLIFKRLAERREDIRPLLEYFTQYTSISALSEEEYAYAESYHWPGEIPQIVEMVHSTAALMRSEKIDFTTACKKFCTLWEQLHHEECSRLTPVQEIGISTVHALTTLEQQRYHLRSAAAHAGIDTHSFAAALRGAHHHVE